MDFDYEQFPEERSQLASHGRTEVQQLLDHFSPIFSVANHENILNEYTELVVTLKNYKHSSTPNEEVYASVIRKSERDIVKLLEVMLVLSPSTAECVSGFRLMNTAKT